MQQNKQFDWTTIIVVIVSVILVLSGIYLLNQSSSGNTNTRAVTQNSTNNSANRSVIFSNTSSDSSIDTIEVSSINSENDFSINSSSSLSSESSSDSSSSRSATTNSSSISSSSSSESSISSSSSSSPSIDNEYSEVSEDEAYVKILEDSGDRKYRIEVLSSGVENAQFWKVGRVMSITNSTKLDIDGVYKVMGIEEKDGRFSYDLIVSEDNSQFN